MIIISISIIITILTASASSAMQKWRDMIKLIKHIFFIKVIFILKPLRDDMHYAAHSNYLWDKTSEGWYVPSPNTYEKKMAKKMESMG